MRVRRSFVVRVFITLATLLVASAAGADVCPEGYPEMCDAYCCPSGSECDFFSGTCESGHCRDGTDLCGGLGQDRCSFFDCTAGYVASDPITCEACGDEGQPCCEDGYCGPGLGCGSFGDCEPCGLPNQPCCDGLFCVSGSCDVFGDCP